MLNDIEVLYLRIFLDEVGQVCSRLNPAFCFFAVIVLEASRFLFPSLPLPNLFQILFC